VEPFNQVELQLAARNHGMPLEALRYPVTPAGLHYLLIHYDIPVVDPTTFSLTIEGRGSRPLTLSLDDLRARPAGRGGAPGRRPPRLRPERRQSAPAARLPAPAGRPRLVRNGQRQVADPDH